jgi:WD40 repeat protein
MADASDPVVLEAHDLDPDGRVMLTGSVDKTARLWDAATGAPIGSPLTHQDWVASVAYSPDGRTALTGC